MIQETSGPFDKAFKDFDNFKARLNKSMSFKESLLNMLNKIGSIERPGFQPEPDEERISPDSAFVVGRRGKREAFLSGRVARNIGNISGHPMALSADRKSRRCVVCCEMCNRGDQTHVHRHGARTRFGCTKCYVGFARYKSRLCGKRSRISETENNEIINLCNKPNVEGDTRSCFQIHHESQG
jgi:hypothetical protein